MTIRKKAEDYGNGSSSGDFLGVMDGTETLQDGINTNEASNGDDQGAVPDGGRANHPVTPLGEQGHETENMSGAFPYSETEVDDNHANNADGISASLFNIFIKTSNEDQYKNINSPEVAPPASIINNIKHKYQDIAHVHRPMSHQPKVDLDNLSVGDKLNIDDFGPAVVETHNWYDKKSPINKDLKPIKPYEFESGDMRQGPYDNNGLDIFMNRNPKGLPYSLNIFNLLTNKINKQADETNFFLQNSTSGGAADSPETMQDGHPREELSEQEGMDSVINNTPHPTNEADVPMIEDPNIVDKNKDRMDVNPKSTPDIYKGHTFAHLKQKPHMSTSMGALFKKANTIPFNVPERLTSEERIKHHEESEPEEAGHMFHMLQPAPIKGKTPPAFERFEEKPMADKSMFSQNNLKDKLFTIFAFNPDTDYKNHSNVADVMAPDEQKVKHDHATHDFGTGDEVANDTMMGDAPLAEDGQTEEEKNYSGRDNSTASLLNLFIKIANEDNYLHEDITNEDGTLEGNHPWLNNTYAQAGKVDMLPVKWLKQFKGNELRPGELEPLQKDIAQNGIKEPLQLGIGQKDRTVSLGEGNHRLQAAINLGMTHVPVRGFRQQNIGGVPYDKMSRVPSNDYFPADFAPREAFDEWSHLRQPKPKQKNIEQSAFLNLMKKAETEQEKHPDWYDKKGKLKCAVCGSTKNDIRGRLCGKCMIKQKLKKEADYTGLLPSQNPNSGQDEDYPDSNGQTYSDIGQTMTDGKVNSDHMDDKIMDDSNEYRKKINYNRNRPSTEDSTQDYFHYLNTGGGFGGEGSGNFSGVDNT